MTLDKVERDRMERENEAYYEWQEKNDRALYEAFATAVQDLRARGWSREELELAFEDVVDR